MALFLSVRVFCYDSRLKVNFNFIPINKKEKQKKIIISLLKELIGTSMVMNKRYTISYISKEKIRVVVMQFT